MTHAERLIHQLCKERQLELQEQHRLRATEINAAKNVPYARLPKGVREALKAWESALSLIERKKKYIKSMGFHPPYDPSRALKDDGGALTWDGTDREHERNNESKAALREKLDSLKTAAIIASLGKTPNEARPILEKLQKDLKAL